MKLQDGIVGILLWHFTMGLLKVFQSSGKGVHTIYGKSILPGHGG